MSTLRLVGEPPAAIRSRLAVFWPGSVQTSSEPADVVLCWAAGPTELLGAIDDQCKARADRWWLHFTNAGIDPRVAQAVDPARTVVSNGSGTHGLSVAEHVLAVLLSMTRGLVPLARAQAERRWLTTARAVELHGLTACVLGTGDLGTCTARLLRACGVRVVGVRRGAVDAEGFDATFPVGRLHTALRGSRVLVVAVPLTSHTQGLVGREELALLEPRSYLVNVARGPVVDGPAVLDALDNGQLAGAALDVFDHEPLVAASPWWDRQDVIVTPHCADATPGTDERAYAQFEDYARHWLDGEPLPRTADVSLGPKEER